MSLQKPTYCTELEEGPEHIRCFGTVFQFFAASTILEASRRPNPNLWLKWNPPPLSIQPSSTGDVTWAVFTIKCCTSRHVKFGLQGKDKLGRDLIIS